MGIPRKLEAISQSLAIPADQEEAMEFLANAKNVQKINDLVEDIHEVLMDYQVCTSGYLFSNISDLCARLHYNKISTMRVVFSL